MPFSLQSVRVKNPQIPVSFLTNEKTQVSESESHLWKKWTVSPAEKDKRKNTYGPHFVKKLMGPVIKGFGEGG